MTVSKSMKVGDVKKAVLSSLKPTGVAIDSLIVCNQKGGMITEMFDDAQSCNDIEQDRETTMVYHVPNQTSET